MQAPDGLRFVNCSSLLTSSLSVLVALRDCQAEKSGVNCKGKQRGALL